MGSHDDGTTDPVTTKRQARTAARRREAIAEARADHSVMDARLHEVEAIAAGRVAEVWVDDASETHWIYTFQNGGRYFAIPHDLTSRPGEAFDVADEELNEMIATAAALRGTENWIRCRQEREHPDGVRLILYTFDGTTAYEPDDPAG